MKRPRFLATASLAGKEFDFSLKAALKKGPVVVYFYPSAYTKGCDLEAHTFAQEEDKFDAAGATIDFGDGLVGYALGRSSMTFIATTAPRGFGAVGSVSITAESNNGPIHAVAPLQLRR